MPTPLVLVLLIAGRDDAVASAASIRAARAALPIEASLLVRHVEALPSDRETIAEEQRDGARAIAVITWVAGDGSRVRLHVHRADEDRFVDRELAFSSQQAPNGAGAESAVERGRTIGFAIASMVPEIFGENPEIPLESAPLAIARAPTPIASGTKQASARAPERDAIEAEATRPPPKAGRAALDAAVVAAIGIAGHAGGVGARLGFGYFFGRVALRIDGTVRLSDLPQSQSSSLVFSGGPGLGANLVTPDPKQPFYLGARANALAILHIESHLSDEPSPIRQSRWLPGASLVLEGGYRLSDGASLLLSGGTEIAFGTTKVFLKDREVATIPPFRLVADAGIRVQF